MRVGRWLVAAWLCAGASQRAAAQPPRPPYEGRVAAPTAPPSRSVPPLTLQGEELRSTAGALGDPFRILSLLPGVATPLPMLPMFSVRGASPGMTGFFIDGMRVPQLFHLLVGGGVIHAGTISRLDFFAGGYDATWGRFAGGIAAASTRPADPPEGRHHRVELELRLLDVSGLVELRLPRGVRISASGHYGYPGPILSAIDDRIHLSYWDYQLRLDWSWLTVQAFGSHDELGLQSGLVGSFSAPNVRTVFHRAQLRARGQRGGLSAEAAISGGLDEVGSRSGSGVSKRFLAARASLWQRGSWLSLYAAVDGELASFQSDGIELPSLSGFSAPSFGHGESSGPSRRDELGEIAEPRTGVTAGAVLQASAELIGRRLTLTAGGRVDVYHAGAQTALGFDPRAQLRLQLLRWLELRLAAGVYQQPPSFPIQLPGIDTFALQLGLQRATHFSLTEELRLGAGLSVQATGYYQRFARATDLPPLGAQLCAPPPASELSGYTAELLRVVDGTSMGMELLVRRSGERIAGWIAYTLSRAERELPCGLRPADYDQTHVLNLVAQVRLPRAVRLGARLYVATGRPDTQPLWPDYKATLRNNIRLPTYGQLDVRIDKEWRLRRVSLLLVVEVVNATFSESVLQLGFPEDPSSPLGIDATRPEYVGFRWLLPSIGLRAVF
jgi:hypothetical protein